MLAGGWCLCENARRCGVGSVWERNVSCLRGQRPPGWAQIHKYTFRKLSKFHRMWRKTKLNRGAVWGIPAGKCQENMEGMNQQRPPLPEQPALRLIHPSGRRMHSIQRAMTSFFLPSSISWNPSGSELLKCCYKFLTSPRQKWNEARSCSLCSAKAPTSCPLLDLKSWEEARWWLKWPQNYWWDGNSVVYE